MKIDKNLEGHTATWCPGCGDWGISVSIKAALTELGYSPSDVAVMFDIGCSGNMNDVLNAYSMHTLHGRSIPPAVGVSIANHKFPVLVVGGDGAIFGEGGNHFIHACRGNHNVTVLIHDNRVYGLTTGQVAPTADHGFKARSTPDGLIEIPVNPLSLAVTSGATFVAQAFAGNALELIKLIKAGVQHNGFSVINVLQPCVTFNKINTYQYYNQRIYRLDEKYDPTNYHTAVLESLKLEEEKFPVGILYNVNKPTYKEQLPQLSEKTLIEKEPFTGISELLQEFC
jgi:2-oxoglutarate ferredoxin oxidoreductase subunit beta